MEGSLDMGDSHYGYQSGSARFNATESPLPIAVFVASPTRPPVAHGNNFKLRDVHPDDLDESNPKFDPTCAVCLADIRSAPVAELTCGHRFHKRCASDWLRKASSPVCQLCNIFIGEDDGDGEAVV